MRLLGGCEDSARSGAGAAFLSWLTQEALVFRVWGVEEPQFPFL